MSPPSISATSAQPKTSADSGYLSREDVALLLREDSAAARITILEKITSHYSSERFNTREYEYAEQIFRLLMKDTESRVRQTLAERVKLNPNIPRDIVLHLAEDVEQVSIPILRASQVLNDADLIRIIETSRETSKLMAITERDTISGKVSHALVETHHAQVIGSLLSNKNAAIDDVDYEQIVSTYPHEQSVMSAMVKRGDLPVSVAEKLLKHVSGQMAEELALRYDLLPSDLEQQTREHLTLAMLPPRSAEQDIDLMVEQMAQTHRLTTTIVLSSLCRGHLDFFDAALARLAGVPKANASRLIRDKGMLGFQAIYGKAGMPESMFGAVRVLLQAALAMAPEKDNLSATQYANRVVQELLVRTQGQDIDNIPYIIALVRQSAAAH